MNPYSKLTRSYYDHFERQYYDHTVAEQVKKKLTDYIVKNMSVGEFLDAIKYRGKRINKHLPMMVGDLEKALEREEHEIMSEMQR